MEYVLSLWEWMAFGLRMYVHGVGSLGITFSCRVPGPFGSSNHPLGMLSNFIPKLQNLSGMQHADMMDKIKTMKGGLRVSELLKWLLSGLAESVDKTSGTPLPLNPLMLRCWDNTRSYHNNTSVWLYCLARGL